MITIHLLRSKRGFRGYEISGHADTAPHGEDVVCAAVSVLAFYIANTFREVCKITEFQALDIEEGHFLLEVSEENLHENQWDNVQVLLQGLLKNAEQLAQQYPDAVTVFRREVE